MPTAPRAPSGAAQRLVALAAGAPSRRPNVRSLAMFAANSTCRLATLGFAARVDFDALLSGTRYAAPYGQSPFAFRRGNRFEERLRQDGHAPMLALLGEALGYDVAGARVENLREGFGRGPNVMPARAERTAALVGDIIAGKRRAPNLLDGAVLGRVVGGQAAYFEADAVAARFAAPIHAGEIKSFPTVDGQADPDKVGAAIAQIAIYILLLRELVERTGGDPAVVSGDALLITAKNTGLQPTITVKPVGREVDRARRILDEAPSVDDLASSLPAKVPSFVKVYKGEESQRVEAAHQLAEEVGTNYRPDCLSSCGFSRLCRDRAQATGSPCRVGPQLLRLLPSVDSLDRAAALAHGSPPAPHERSVAEQLTRAARYRALLAPDSAPSRTPKKKGRS